MCNVVVGGHAWQGVLHDRGVCGRVVLGVWQGRGDTWQGMHMWQEKQLLKRAVYILLECILVELVNVASCSHHNVLCVDKYNLQI